MSLAEPCIYNGVDITDELLREFERGWHFDAVQAKLRQQQAAAERKRLGPVAATVQGTLQAQIDPFWYHYWGQREGYEIFSDEREMERFARDTPELKIERVRRARAPGARELLRNAECGLRNSELEILDRFGRAVA